MKRFGIFLAAAICVAGCGAPSNSSTTPSAESANKSETKPTGFSVALLTPGPTSDAGWSAMAYEGLKAIESDLGATVNNQQNVSDAQSIKDAMRQYAREGYKLVFGHGYEYNEPAIEIAKDFPNTIFVSSSGSQTAENVGAFRFKLEEGFFLAGYVAGSMSKSGKVAMIGGDNVASIKSTFKGFKAGVLAANPKATVLETFTGDGQDVAKAKQATQAAIGEGADFVVHQANAAAPGVFQACKEKGVWAFGANLDQNADESGAVLASAVIVAKGAFLSLAKQVKEGTYKGSVSTMGMKDEAIDFIWNPKLMDKVPAELIKKIVELRDAIKEGKQEVPMDQF